MNELIEMFKNDKSIEYNYLIDDFDFVLRIIKLAHSNHMSTIDYINNNNRLYLFNLEYKTFREMDKSKQIEFLKFLESKFNIIIRSTNLIDFR